jgi:hypothetical protein
MSANPSPIHDSTAPFEPTSTPTIDRANRLISLRANPGFGDLRALSQELVNEAAMACARYGGWDAQQIVVMKVRQQCALEHHEQLLQRINSAIQAGLDEARALISDLPEKTPEDAMEQGDYVRVKVLEKFDEMDSRVPGSF